MKKNFLFKWVSVLGAVLLLATSVMPGLQYAYAQETPAQQAAELVYDLIYDEASWNAAYNKEGSALKEYYEDYPDEDRWCLDDTEAWWHYWRVADKVNEAWPDTCVQSWKGAVNAAGAKYPWAVINVPEGWLKGTIIFEYGDIYVGDNAKAPFGQYVTLNNSFAIASIPGTFGNDDFKVDANGEWSTFDVRGFSIKYIPAEFTELTKDTDWFYVNDTTSFNNAKTQWKKPLEKYYRDYPWADLWADNGSWRGHATVNASCIFNSYWDAEKTIPYASNWVVKWGEWIEGDFVRIIVDSNPDYEGFVGNTYYIKEPANTREKKKDGSFYQLYSDANLANPLDIWVEIVSCSYPGYSNKYEWAVAWGGVFPRIAIGFDSATQLKIVLKYYDNSNENNIIDKFVRLGNWNDNRDWALAEVPSVLWLDEITPAKLKVILVGDEHTAEEINQATYPTKTVSFETDWWSTVESQPVELWQKATEPETNPTKEGFAFVDWYTSEDGGQTLSNEPFDFDTPIGNDITLYAKWASTAWEMYAIHALPVVGGDESCDNMGGGNQCKANSADNTYTTADGTYTIKNSDHTLTYSDVTIKDPDATTNENWIRPEWYVRFWVRFLYPEAITDNATFKWNNFCDWDNCYFKKSNWYVDSRWQALSSAQLQGLISNGAKTKEWEIKASWNGTEEETFKVVLDLKNVEIKDPTNKSVIKVEDYKIVSIWNNPAYTITFDTDGWSAVASISANEWDSVTAPANPTKDGYTFAGWDKTIPTTMPAENMTIKAKWTKKSSGGSSSWGGGGGSSSYSCKNLPDNATANNTTKPTKSTNYSYDTDTTKVCTFQCNKGYKWNEKDAKCEKSDSTDTVDSTNNVDNTNNNNNTNKSEADAKALADGYSQEFIDAYNWAYSKGITTMPTINEAQMDQPLTRIAMAKMLSQYAINVLGKTPDTTKVVPAFPDVDAKLDADYNNWVTLAYQLWIMWINVDKYRPFDLVTRAEFGTALSRMLYGLSDGEWDQWYKTHLDKLMEEQIITNNNPNLQELRGYVMIMLMRSAQ